MRWDELLLALVDRLSATLAAAGQPMPVYLGGWATDPKIDCVHVIRGNCDQARAAVDGCIDQTVHIENWVYVEPLSVDQGEVNAQRLAGYARLGMVERLTLQALRDFQRNAPEGAEVVFADERILPDGDMYVPSHASQISITVRLWDADLC